MRRDNESEYCRRSFVQALEAGASKSHDIGFSHGWRTVLYPLRRKSKARSGLQREVLVTWTPALVKERLDRNGENSSRLV